MNEKTQLQRRKGRVRRAVRQLQSSRRIESSFRILDACYRRDLWHYFRRRGVGREEAEDLVQECFLALNRGIGSYRWEASFRHWLFGLARNIYRGHVRRAVSRRGLTEIPWTNIDEREVASLARTRQCSPLEEAQRQERARRLLSAVCKLPMQMRRCVLLHIEHDYDAKTIADLLHLEPSTVRVQLLRARRTLRRRLSRLAADHPPPSQRGAGSEGISAAAARESLFF